MDDHLSRQILDWVNADDYHPVKPRSLFRRIQPTGPDRERFRESLLNLLETGRIREDDRGRIIPKSDKGQLVGTIKKVAKGGAFLITESGAVIGKDVFIPPEDLHDAHTGDEVVVRLTRRRGAGGRRLGKIEEILNRASSSFVGTYSERQGHGFVRIDADQFDRPVPVGDPGAKPASPGDKVVIEMLRFPTHARAGEAVITEVLGPDGEPEVDTLAIIYEFHLPREFPPIVLEEAAKLAREFDDEQIDGRQDLTGETIITIDPKDARDFDDAISLSRSDDGHWHLGIHIADVAYFVKPNSALDLEARSRGTSVYLPGLVIPMLPEVLSNGLASLQEGRRRFVKTVQIELDAELRVIHVKLADSVIKVARRFTYEEVLPIVTDRMKTKSAKMPPDIKRLLLDMYRLAMGLRQKRFEQGAIELDLAETKLELNRSGAVKGITKVTHDASHQIIEEFMLAANEAVAMALSNRHLPFIHRAHGEPDEDKLQLFGEFAGTLGFQLQKFQSRRELQDLLDRVRDQPLEQAINYALLRSFRQAEYTVADEGHYALAKEYYCHFTSPIRRYPDLTVARQSSSLMARGKRGGKTSEQELDAIAHRCSDLSRRAEAAERELIKIKLLRFMADRVGEEIEAIVTGVERFGAFCRGTEIPVEGLLHITAIGGAFGEVIDFDATAHALIARTSGRSLQLGQPIQIKIARVDMPARKLEFVLSPEAVATIGKPRRKRNATAPKPPHKKTKKKKSSGKPPNARQPSRRRRRQ